jgi:hypothetical protein
MSRSMLHDHGRAMSPSPCYLSISMSILYVHNKAAVTVTDMGLEMDLGMDKYIDMDMNTVTGMTWT